MQAPPYIIPIIAPDKYGEPAFVGSGFIVGNYLITAGHVASYKFGFGLSANIGHQTIPLGNNNKKIMFSPSPKDMTSFDLAVFSIVGSDISSPLIIAEGDPEFDDKQEAIMTSMHFQPIGNGDADYSECECLVTRKNIIPDFFFEGFNINKTGPGSSGSPLIKDNVVYGMVVQGCQYKEEDFTTLLEIAKEGGMNDVSLKDIYALNQRIVFLKASEIRKRMAEAGLI